MDAAAFQSVETFLERVPYARFLGMKVEFAGEQMTAVLPFAQHLVGNPMIPALHGGVIGAFLEMTALAQIALVHPSRQVPKTIDVNIDYLRSARAQTTYARAVVRKLGRRVANVQAEAWQDDPAQPVAGLSGHFLLRNPQ